MATLGAKLLKLRIDHKLSQTELAEIVGVSQNAYCKWEADKSKPQIENLFKISQYYQVDMKEFLDDAGSIVFTNSEIKGGNIIGNNPSNNTLNIQLPAEIMENILKTQEQLSKLIDSQFQMIAELLKKKEE
jgi:transcriptional regulator with XRE-family HTH domain